MSDEVQDSDKERLPGRRKPSQTELAARKAATARDRQITKELKAEVGVRDHTRHKSISGLAWLESVRLVDRQRLDDECAIGLLRSDLNLSANKLLFLQFLDQRGQSLFVTRCYDQPDIFA